MSYIFLICFYKMNNFNFKFFEKFQGFEIKRKIKNEISIKMRW